MSSLQNTNLLTDLSQQLGPSGYSYLLIVAAEMGDKSQLVCMTLAARYRATPVVLGATLAFLLLNGIAVVLGANLSHWAPDGLVTGAAGLMFIGFGIHSLLSEDSEVENGDENSLSTSSSAFFTTFLLLFLAELGDKTQVAVLGLATTEYWVGVFIGATLALITTTVLAVWIGRDLLTKLPMHQLHRLSGLLFLGFGVFALFTAVQSTVN